MVWKQKQPHKAPKIPPGAATVFHTPSPSAAQSAAPLLSKIRAEWKQPEKKAEAHTSTPPRMNASLTTASLLQPAKTPKTAHTMNKREDKKRSASFYGGSPWSPRRGLRYHQTQQKQREPPPASATRQYVPGDNETVPQAHERTSPISRSAALALSLP